MLILNSKTAEGKNDLRPGTVLHLNGYDNPNYVIIRNDGPTEKFSNWGSRYHTIKMDVEKPERMVHDAFGMKFESDGGCGIQMYITSKVLDPEEIMDWIDRANAYETKKIHAKEQEAAARDTETQRLKDQNKDLIEGSDRVTAAKNIRKELKKAFPGVKFSVKSKSFSMGNSIDIYWNDGPTSASVDKITSKYQYGDFNGMEDIYEYSDRIWTDIFGGSKYVMTNRNLTETGFNKLMNLLNVNDATFQDYEQGRLRSKYLPGDTRDVGQLMYELMKETAL